MSRQPASARSITALGAAAALVAFLNVTALNAGFPELQRSFPGVGVRQLGWTVTAYGAALAAALIPAGGLADAVGLVGFGLASAASVAASSILALVLARGAQGIAAGVIGPASFGLVLREAPESERGRAVGIWSAAAAGSALAGPTLGGLLVEAAGWRALLALDVALGAALLVAVLWAAPVRPRRAVALPDPVGGALLVAGVGLLVVAAGDAAAWGWLDARTLAITGTAAASLALALARAARARAPALDLRLLRQGGFALANLTSLVFAFAVFAWLLAAPLFAATVWRYDALAAALSVTPGAIAATAASVPAGRLGPRGRRRVVVGGAVLFAAVSAALVPALGPSPRFLAVWLPAGVVSGLAIGAVLTSLSAEVASTVPPDRFAAAAGVNMTARQLGGSLGVAVLAALVGDGEVAAPAFTAVWLTGAVAGLVAGLLAVRLRRGSPRGARPSARVARGRTGGRPRGRLRGGSRGSAGAGRRCSPPGSPGRRRR